MKRIGDGMRQVHLLNHMREKIAVWLAPWAIYEDIREYHRDASNQDRDPAKRPT